MALTVAALSGCTYAGDVGAPMPVVRRSLELLGSQPSPASLDAPLGAPIVLLFDVPIAGESVGGTAVRVFSGRIEVSGATRVDQLSRTIAFVPAERLRPRLQHRVRLSDTIRGLDGSRLAEPLVFDFESGDEQSSTDQSPGASAPAPTIEELQPLWNRRCTSCHGVAASHPRAGLDLASPAAALRSLVRVRSTEVELLRVDPGGHASSYLLRKLIGRYNIAGMPMPPAEEDRLTADELRSVADWIDGGAR